MSVNQPTHQVAVDRREETVVTQQLGYAATEQVTRDVAAERRLGLFQVTRSVREQTPGGSERTTHITRSG